MAINRKDFLKTLGGMALFTIIPRRVLGGPGHVAPNDQLTKGIIGTGGIAHGHARGYLAAKGAQLVALCDIDGARLEAFAKQYGVDAPRCYRDYRELLACPDIDAVDICTPNYLHSEIAIAAFEAGKHVFSEKMIAVELDEGREPKLIHTVRGAGYVLREDA